MSNIPNSLLFRRMNPSTPHAGFCLRCSQHIARDDARIVAAAATRQGRVARAKGGARRSRRRLQQVLVK